MPSKLALYAAGQARGKIRESDPGRVLAPAPALPTLHIIAPNRERKGKWIAAAACLPCQLVALLDFEKKRKICTAKTGG